MTGWAKSPTRRLDGMIVGAQKASTTSALAWLRSCPTINVQRFRDFNYFNADEEFGKGYPRARRFYFPEADGKLPILAKHANLWSLPESLARLQQHNPEVKLAVLLRDPVTRAYSAYRWARVEGWESASTFSEALRPDRQDRSASPNLTSICDYLGNGRYAEKIVRLWEMFGREHVFVMFDTEFFVNPNTTFGGFLNSVGVTYDGGPVPQVNSSGAPRSAVARRLLQSRTLARLSHLLLPRVRTRALRYQIAGWNSKPEADEEMPARIESQLREYFAAPDAELAELLGRPLPWPANLNAR